MTSEIKKILAELYQLDDSLRQFEPKLEKLITTLMSQKPETKFDSRFAARLRAQLLAQAKSESSSFEAKSLITNFNFMKRFGYILGGAVLAAILIIPTLTYFSSVKPTAEIGAGPAINKVAARALGALPSTADNAAAPLASGQAAGLGAGAAFDVTKTESSLVSASPTVVIGRGGGGGGVGVLPPDFVNYRYVYRGDPATLVVSNLPVLRRLKGGSAGAALAKLVGNVSFAGIDLASFPGSSVENITFVQNQDYGYMINLNFSEGIASINQNWPRWQTADSLAEVYQPLSLNDLPEEQKLIDLANQFIASHKISLTGYGQPVVRNDWRQWLNAENTYVPDIISVVYPGQINHQPVYTQDGSPDGLNVNIDIRRMRVTDLWLKTQQYESSDYPLETEVDKILALAEVGGWQNWGYPEATRTVTLELGRPKTGYIQIWNYAEGKNEELLVPALIFPVTNQPEDQNFYRQNIVVPLVQDLFQAPQPMPLMIKSGSGPQTDASGAGQSGSAEAEPPANN